MSGVCLIGVDEEDVVLGGAGVFIGCLDGDPPVVGGELVERVEGEDGLCGTRFRRGRKDLGKIDQVDL